MLQSNVVNNMDGIDIVERARIFATAAHAAVKQKRKYTGENYIVHPGEVAGIVASLPGVTPEMIAAAWLHDVLEDTGVDYSTLVNEFGEEVASLVLWLTNASKPEDGNRKTRKEIDRKHIAGAPPKAKTIKLADLLSNCKSITKYDPEFAVVYLEEKKQMMEVLTEGDETLYKIVNDLL